MAKFTVSATALRTFMSGCFYRYKLYRQYTRLKISPAERFGILVHKYMEELAEPSASTNREWDVDALDIAMKMRRILENQGYRILATEVEHIAPLCDGIQVFGIIDTIALLDDTPVLIDYKTASRRWKEIKTEEGEIIIPKMEGFQGPIYLTPPYENKHYEGEWPNELHYIVVPKNGTSRIWPYYENDAGRQRTIQAAKMLKDAVDRGWFPKNLGWTCENCDWVWACMKKRGWQRYHGVKE